MRLPRGTCTHKAFLNADIYYREQHQKNQLPAVGPRLQDARRQLRRVEKNHEITMHSQFHVSHLDIFARAQVLQCSSLEIASQLQPEFLPETAIAKKKKSPAKKKIASAPPEWSPTYRQRTPPNSQHIASTPGRLIASTTASTSPVHRQRIASASPAQEPSPL